MLEMKQKTKAKVIKDTIDIKKHLEKGQKKEDIEDMEIEEDNSDGGEWKQQRNQKKKLRKRNRKNSNSEVVENLFSCDLCLNRFEVESDLNLHQI